MPTLRRRTLCDTQTFSPSANFASCCFPRSSREGTIADIKAALASCNLTFVGFNDAPVGEYAKRFPDDKAMTDLDNWQIIAAEKPGAFGPIYQFWVQKPAEHTAASAPA